MVASLTAAVLAETGAPRAGITVTGLSTTTPSTVTVTVSWDGGATWHSVRGGTVTGALGSTFVRDFACPLNVPATYQAVVMGGSSEVATGTVTATSAQAWIQDPLAPRSAVPLYADMTPGHVLLTLGSLAGGTWAQAVDAVVPLGSNLAVASIGVRQKIAALPLVCTYDVAAEGGALKNLLMTTGQLVVRGLPADALLDPVAHVTVGDAAELRLARGTIAQWTLTARQVAPITMRIIAPWWTYDMVTALVQSQLTSTATYADVLAAQVTGKTYTDWVATPGVL